MGQENMIPAIGLSPLGTYGLDMGGMYSSLNPMYSMMGMSGCYGMGGLGMNGFGMGGFATSPYGMYNPANYMQYLADIQNQIEYNAAQHTNRMHETMLDNEVKANHESISAMVKKTATGGNVDTKLRSLIDCVQSGHLDSVCTSFDVLRQQVLKTYAKEIKAMGGNQNKFATANALIEQMYNDYTGHSLRDDITKYGDGALKNGFLQGYRSGHDKRDVQQAINYCFGDPMTEIEHEKRTKKFGYAVGTGSRVAANSVKGGLIFGTGAGLVTLGATGAIKGVFGSKKVSDDKIKTLLNSATKDGSAITEELKTKITEKAGNNIDGLTKALEKNGVAADINSVKTVWNRIHGWKPLKAAWNVAKPLALVGAIAGIIYGIHNIKKANS